MEQRKRSQNNHNNDYHNIKRIKIRIPQNLRSNCLTRDSITTFEDLSNELIYEIFEYLDFYHVFETFYDLNKRFQDLFIHSNLSIKINISSISKSKCQRYLTHFIMHQTHRIKTLRLSNPFATDMTLLLFPIITNLTRLESLIITNIESKYIKQIINHLSSLPMLSLLIIISIDTIKNQNGIYQKIFRLPALKYCQMFFNILRERKHLHLPTNEFSLIEHLVINDQILINQLDNLLSCVPQLRRLSLNNLYGFSHDRTLTKSITLNYLTHVSLRLYAVHFEDFESITKDFFHKVEILRIYVRCQSVHLSNTEYLNGNRWERLISTHMLNLRIFDFQHQDHIYDYKDDTLTYETHINMFNSSFWIKRQWFFESQWYTKKHYGILTFYSTNPYRRKYYDLCRILGENIELHGLETIDNRAQHICIHDTNAMETFMGNFRNATELTLFETFNICRNSIVTDLSRIIPLKQLSTLSLDYHHLSFKKVIELLGSTPRLHTLKLNSISLFRLDPASIQQNPIFSIVSITNTIKNVTINQNITLEKLELLINLVPRLEYLTINLNEQDLKYVTRFLLSNRDKNTRHLSLLCISKHHKHMVENMRLLIQKEKLLDDFTIKGINRRVYLWW
ncbi:unnamed protein product [Rotaria sordida]|uniref:F-box domain-containing protein n=1 Tax=Rotaria sordida TaxID=392033 RepID=A0A818T2U6_9BILA|nr:unnamed protein product [Rotaria sordida]